VAQFWLDQWIEWVADRFPEGTYLAEPIYLRGLLAIVLVSLICGAVGSLVVGNRMAFFSDALAHCAFAGISLALLVGMIFGLGFRALEPWVAPIMVGFGIVVGLGIAVVRDKTAQASDTVIGVFFAGAIGFGAVMLKAASARAFYSPENFLFGDIVFVTGHQIVALFGLAVVTLVFLMWMNNRLVIASFNQSLARSRRINVQLCNYLFIVLLAAIVNLCLITVGALLINALLIVPAATAANLCRNLRQLFWCSVSLCLVAGVTGQWLSRAVPVATSRGYAVHAGESGTVVVVSVILFFLSMAVGPWLKSRRPAQAPVPAQAATGS
jgi:zinc transport system permease protein